MLSDIHCVWWQVSHNSHKYCPVYSVLLFLRCFYDVLSLFLSSMTMVRLAVVIPCYFYCYFLFVFWKKLPNGSDFFNPSTCYLFHCHSFCLSCSFSFTPHFLASFAFPTLYCFLSLTIYLGLTFLVFDTSQLCSLFGRLYLHTIV